MGAMSLGHWLIVLVVLLLVFGPKRLANVGQGLGEGLRSFRKGLDDKGADDLRAEVRVEEKVSEPSARTGG